MVLLGQLIQDQKLAPQYQNFSRSLAGLAARSNCLRGGYVSYDVS